MRLRAGIVVLPAEHALNVGLPTATDAPPGVEE